MMLHTWPVQVIMAFVDNWVEGVDQYVGWAGLSDHVSFFTDPKVMQLYKNNVQVLTSRVNTINGRKYSEDPTIFAWDLINEPRCNSDCPAGTISVSTGCSDQTHDRTKSSVLTVEMLDIGRLNADLPAANIQAACCLLPAACCLLPS